MSFQEIIERAASNPLDTGFPFGIVKILIYIVVVAALFVAIYRPLKNAGINIDVIRNLRDRKSILSVHKNNETQHIWVVVKRDKDRDWEILRCEKCKKVINRIGLKNAGACEGSK